MFKDKTMLIAGGTGTFGNAVLKRFLDTDITEIRKIDDDDFHFSVKHDNFQFSGWFP